MTRMSPERVCAMCNGVGIDRGPGRPSMYSLPLYLQYKFDGQPWQDATWNHTTRRWQIAKDAPHMRWLCHKCKRQTAGNSDSKERYTPYRAPRRKW